MTEREDRSEATQIQQILEPNHDELCISRLTKEGTKDDRCVFFKKLLSRMPKDELNTVLKLVSKEKKKRRRVEVVSMHVRAPASEPDQKRIKKSEAEEQEKGGVNNEDLLISNALRSGTSSPSLPTSNQLGEATTRASFVCKYCDKSFATPTGRSRHKQIQHNNKRYLCDFEGCSKSYTRLETLKSHKNAHCTIPVLFRCSYGCDKEYGSSSNLRKHIRKHHNN